MNTEHPLLTLEAGLRCDVCGLDIMPCLFIHPRQCSICITCVRKGIQPLLEGLRRLSQTTDASAPDPRA